MLQIPILDTGTTFAYFLYVSFQEVEALFDTAQVIPVEEAVRKLFLLNSSKCRSTCSLPYNFLRTSSSVAGEKFDQMSLKWMCA